MSKAEGSNGPDKPEKSVPTTRDSKEKKKKSKSLGSRLVRKELDNQEETAGDRRLPSLLDLDLSRKEDKPEEPKDRARQKTEEASVETAAERDELGEVAEITPEEQSYISKFIRGIARESRLKEPEGIVHEALDEFDAKIIEGDKEPGRAMDEVLTGLDIDPPVSPGRTGGGEELPETSESESGPPSGLHGLSEEDKPWLDQELVASSAGRPPGRGGENGTGEADMLAVAIADREPEDRQTRFIGATPAFAAPSATSTERPKVVARDRLRYIDLSEGFLTSSLYIGSMDYLIGRRRGRLKAEGKAKKIQKKLETKVQEIEADLSDKEFTIRQLVSEKAKSNLSSQVERREHKKTVKNIQKKAEKNIMEQRMERERAVAPEAQRLHSTKKAPEKIGKLLVTGEAPLIAATAGAALLIERQERTEKKQQPKKPEFVEPLNSTKIETMGRKELLDTSSRIMVNGNSLRQIYETHLIGERGLRRLVAEHARGGDVQRALRHEIVEREIDFERDPHLRGARLMGNAGPGEGADSNTILKRMIREAEASVSSQEEEVAFYKAKADYEVNERVRQQKKRKVIDTGIVTIVVVLVIVIVMITLLRG